MGTKTAKLGRIIREASQRQYPERSVRSGRNRSLKNTGSETLAITTSVEIPSTMEECGEVYGATPQTQRRDGRLAMFQSAT